MHYILFIKEKRGIYSYKESSNREMDILGTFLVNDLGCQPSSIKEWVLISHDTGTATNLTDLVKDDGKIILQNIYSEEEVPTEVKITIQNFVKLLEDWQEKVCNIRPSEVIIKEENGEFIIETNE